MGGLSPTLARASGNGKRKESKAVFVEEEGMQPDATRENSNDLWRRLEDLKKELFGPAARTLVVDEGGEVALSGWLPQAGALGSQH